MGTEVFLNVSYSSSLEYCYYVKDNRPKPGNLQTERCSFGYPMSVAQKSTFTLKAYCGGPGSILARPGRFYGGEIGTGTKFSRST